MCKDTIAPIIPAVLERVRWEDELATDVGTPAAYDYGPERCSWLMHQLTNWMGDDGFLLRHQSQIRHHNVVGDWISIDGKVIDNGRLLGRDTGQPRVRRPVVEPSGSGLSSHCDRGIVTSLHLDEVTRTGVRGAGLRGWQFATDR